MRVLSADWVLPVEGAPIENGAVAIEDGRIAAVGTIDELGEGDHFAEAAIVPGFVNAHSHLEYAVYAGFGDGLSFAPGSRRTSSAKRGSTAPDMEAIARLGAAQCLALRDHDRRRRGLHGRVRARLRRARPAGDRLPRGLRPRPAPRRCGSSRRSARTSPRRSRIASASASRRTRPTPARREVYAACLALGAAGGDAPQREPGRARLAAARRGPLAAGGALLVDPDGQSGIRSLAAAGLLDPAHRRSALRQGRRRGDRHARAPRRRRRPLPPVERAAGLRGRAARRAARGRAPGRHRHRRRLLRPLARRVRGAAGGDLGRARPQRACRRTFADRGARAGDAGRRPRARARSR